jgi:GABA(A) receptor-associated protein
MNKVSSLFSDSFSLGTDYKEEVSDDFKDLYTFEKRKLEAERIIEKYPDRIPIIVQVSKNSSLPPLDKKKYLVPGEITVGQFMYIIRKRIKITEHEAIFLFINDTLPPSSALINEIYKQHKDTDNFLYCTVQNQETFG